MFRIAVMIWLVYAGGLAAQTFEDLGATANAATPVVSTSILIGDLDIADWESLATRAEGIAETGNASRFALARVRSELIGWRDVFFDASDVNADRLATVADQLAALGAAPEGAEEAAPIADRRAALLAQQDRLSYPHILAREALARANGLITEIDRQRRARDAAELLERNGTPVNPASWAEAITWLRTAVTVIWSEAWANSATMMISGRLIPRLALIVVAIAAIIWGVGWSRRALKHANSALPQTDALRRFVLGFAAMAVPVFGVTVIAALLSNSGLAGTSGQAVLNVLTTAGLSIYAAKWLADGFFPTGPDDDGILGYAVDVRQTGRRMTIWLGWVIAGLWLMDALVQTIEIGTMSNAVINLPFQLAIGALMWRLGQAIVHQARSGTTAIFTANRMRRIIGLAVQAVAILGPIAAILGYGAAAIAIAVPAVFSLAVLATITLLQRLSYAAASPTNMMSATDGPDPKGLLPVAINFALAVVALPILALIWGVTIAELQELWTRFLGGFQIGETQLSPGNFLAFIVVFMLGVLITRFIKATLKTTVMPRTRFDLGGQNAVVAGFGYVGIFLSALVAFGVAGIDLSSLAIVAGALSVGIGFGLQNIVSNFVSGIILLIERPIGEGDMIEVGGQMGYVRDISVRSTRIETFDRTDVIVPNADLVSNQVTNWTHGNAVGRAIVPVGVAYGSDTAKVMAILREIAEGHPLVLANPAPSVLLMQFGADSIDFEIRAIIRDVNFVMVVRSEILQSINARFAQEGIEIPFAQRDLWLRNPEALRPTKGDDT